MTLKLTLDMNFETYPLQLIISTHYIRKLKNENSIEAILEKQRGEDVDLIPISISLLKANCSPYLDLSDTRNLSLYLPSNTFSKRVKTPHLYKTNIAHGDNLKGGNPLIIEYN